MTTGGKEEEAVAEIKKVFSTNFWYQENKKEFHYWSFSGVSQVNDKPTLGINSLKKSIKIDISLMNWKLFIRKYQLNVSSKGIE